jgi:hypothetical protein
MQLPKAAPDETRLLFLIFESCDVMTVELVL